MNIFLPDYRTFLQAHATIITTTQYGAKLCQNHSLPKRNSEEFDNVISKYV
jgi:hypothetical protein